MDSTADGREIYSTSLKDAVGVVSKSSSITPQIVTPQPAAVVQEEIDDLSIPVPVGTLCKRHGCGVKFLSEEASRVGEGEGATCRYHPAPVSQLIIMSAPSS